MSIEKAGRENVLIFGSTGLVGSALADHLIQSDLEVICPTRQTVDLTNSNQISDFLAGLSTRPTRIIYAAGLVNPDSAQENPLLAWQVNSQALDPILSWAERAGIPFYYYSTDYVFDGQSSTRPYKETDIAIPVTGSVYGASKKDGEVKTLSIKGSAVLRVMLPYTTNFDKKGDLPRNLINTLRAGKNWTATTDQLTSPVYLQDAVEATATIIKNDAFGIYHLASPDFSTPYDFSLAVAKHLGLDKNKILPTTFSAFSKTRLAPRPQHCWLDTEKFRQDFGENILQNIDSGIERFALATT